jgi:hypothetical protein
MQMGQSLDKLKEGSMPEEIRIDLFPKRTDRCSLCLKMEGNAKAHLKGLSWLAFPHPLSCHFSGEFVFGSN